MWVLRESGLQYKLRLRTIATCNTNMHVWSRKRAQLYDDRCPPMRGPAWRSTIWLLGAQCCAPEVQPRKPWVYQRATTKYVTIHGCSSHWVPRGHCWNTVISKSDWLSSRECNNRIVVITEANKIFAGDTRTGFLTSLSNSLPLFKNTGKIFWEISKVPFEIPHKISYPYIGIYDF